MYNGVSFTQGQTWNDGCDLQCVCEDDTEGYYRCNERFVSLLLSIMRMFSIQKEFKISTQCIERRTEIEAGLI